MSVGSEVEIGVIPAGKNFDSYFGEKGRLKEEALDPRRFGRRLR